MKNLLKKKLVKVLSQRIIITIIVLLILAIVAISAVSGDDIIGHANDATSQTKQAQAEEQAQIYLNEWKIQSKIPGENKPSFEDFMKAKLGEDNVKNNDGVYTLTVNGQTVLATENAVISQLATSATGGMGEKITWTKTSEGDLLVGSTVVTSTGEDFYVIGFKDNNETLILLAKNNLRVDRLAQDTTGQINSYGFCVDDHNVAETENFAAGENLNNNSRIKADTTSAVYRAMQYGATLGVTTGRLMLYSEVTLLQNANGDILYGRNGKSSGVYLNYWLGSTAEYSGSLLFVNGGESTWDCYPDVERAIGVRPVVEISISDISLVQ